MHRRAFFASALALLVGGSAATAGPRASGAAPEETPPVGRGVVGSWLLVIALPGEPPDPHLATFAVDGTFVETARPVQPAPTGAPFRAFFPSPGHGAWTATEARTVDLAFTRLLSDETGAYLGTVPARATIELSADGRTVSGSVTFESVDPAGTVTGSGSGTVRGERIGVGTTGAPAMGTPAGTAGA